VRSYIVHNPANFPILVDASFLDPLFKIQQFQVLPQLFNLVLQAKQGTMGNSLQKTNRSILHRSLPLTHLLNSPTSHSSSTNSTPAFPNSPNPWKVAIIFEELGLEYNIIMLDMFSVKKAPYTDFNPNGRTPTIIDYKNDGFVLWEVMSM
jgi:hypothetical protein